MAYHTSLDIHSIEAVTIANSVVQSGECVTMERIKVPMKRKFLLHYVKELFKL